MFNTAQLSAIEHNRGPMMVLAGPGSGKTTVITHRIKYLVENYGVDERNILVITFTVASANEMKERYEMKVKGANTSATFGTFHSVFFEILRREQGIKVSSVIKPEYKFSMFKEFLVDFEIEYDDEKDIISKLYNEVSKVKEAMLDISNYYPISCPKDKFEKVYNEYVNRLYEEKLIDFDDMQVLVYKLFISDKEVLSRWQKRFSYVLIDEFQDINMIQYNIIKLFVKQHRNIFIVGDDDQSIYQFRGAKPDIMLGFNKDFIDVKAVNLSINYRSTKEIVRVSQKLIGFNKKRFNKDMNTVNERGDAVNLRYFKDEYEELTYLIYMIKKRFSEGVSLEDMAVLVRTNIQPRLLMFKLMEYNIDFQVKERIPNIYEHWISKDIISYMKLAVGSGSKHDFIRIMNKPVRYISRAALKESSYSFYSIKKYYRNKPWMMGRLSDMESEIKKISQMKPHTAIDFIKNIIDYNSYLKEHAKTHGVDYVELETILDEIKSLSKDCNSIQDWFRSIVDYEAELKNKMYTKLEDKTGINIATMHSVKGLEYDTVFIIDAIEGIVPHYKATKDFEIEEERRLFYVAMTRAIKSLNIFYIKERLGKEVEPSTFVLDLLKKTK